MNHEFIEISHVEKSFDQTPVLSDVSANVGAGEVIGLLGLNGSGKTTLLETALGFSVPDNGQVKLFSHDSVHQLTPAVKARIGFVPQQDELIDNMTGKQHLALIASFYPHWNQELINRLVIEWQVPMGQKIIKMSVGQRQKLSILSALGHEPELLILDEPVASLDPLARRNFLKELIEISTGHQRSILFSTHIVSDLERIANRVWVIKDGDIAVDTTMDNVKEHFVRVHLPLGSAVPIECRPALLHQRNEQQSTVLMFKAWSAETEQHLQQHYADNMRIETMSLEDIFLEMYA